VITYPGTQHSRGGRFGSKGWTDGLRAKARAMRDAVHSCSDEYMVWLDADVVVLKPIIERMVELIEKDEKDIVCQQDKSVPCSGVFIVRLNHRTRILFDQMVADDESYEHPLGDQQALKKFHKTVRSGYLPVEEFWTPGYRGPGNWKHVENVDEVVVPDTARVVHANWCVGVDLKEAIMRKALQ